MISAIFISSDFSKKNCRYVSYLLTSTLTLKPLHPKLKSQGDDGRLLGITNSELIRDLPPNVSPIK
jgi:hypothetical protein